MQAHSINPEVMTILIAQHGYNIHVEAKCPLYLMSVFLPLLGIVSSIVRMNSTRITIFNTAIKLQGFDSSTHHHLPCCIWATALAWAFKQERALTELTHGS